MIQALVVVALVGVAAVIAVVVQRRTTPAEPQQGPSWEVPVQVERADFERPDAPWLVAVFTSSTCLACQGTWSKAEILGSDAVAVQRLDAIDDKPVHQRYNIDAVPMILVVDDTGAVRRSFIGEPTATDLWAALAELREPGSVPPGCADVT